MRSKLRSHAALLLFAAVGLLFVGQCVSLFLGAKTLRKTKSALALREQRLASLANSEPAPTQALAAALARELGDLRGAIGEAESLWRDNLITRARSGASLPPNRRAAYFDLARYRQTLTDLAHEQRVEIGPDEFFGFRAYSNEGPEEADILEVHTQRLVLERVLELLLRNSPQRLLAVIREESSERGLGNFEPVDTSCRFQIRFRGTTAVLRAWLNEVSRAELPILVHSVAVEPGTERQVVPIRSRHNSVLPPARFEDADDKDGFGLLVRPSGSEFTVTLDYVELGPEKETEASTGEILRRSKPSPARVVTWLDPEPQRRGPQWVFDVFTPPEIFYHPARQQFRVKAIPPSGELVVATRVLSEVPSAQGHGLRLLGVRHEEYSLQLSGYVGGGTDDAGALLLGLFENRESGETLLLRGGERVESLGVEVLDFRVEERPVAADFEIATLIEPRAVATIRDARGEVRTLREGEQAKGRGLIAQIEREGGLVELREGDFLVIEEGRQLLVVEIQLEPAPRVVMRSPADDAGTDEALETAPLILVFEFPLVDSTH